jgi:hypothetical protein
LVKQKVVWKVSSAEAQLVVAIVVVKEAVRRLLPRKALSLSLLVSCDESLRTVLFLIA